MKKIIIACDLCEQGLKPPENFWSLCGHTVHVCSDCFDKHPLVAKLVSSIRAHEVETYGLAGQAGYYNNIQSGLGKVKA